MYWKEGLTSLTSLLGILLGKSSKKKQMNCCEILKLQNSPQMLKIQMQMTTRNFTSFSIKTLFLNTQLQERANERSYEQRTSIYSEKPMKRQSRSGMPDKLESYCNLLKEVKQPKRLPLLKKRKQKH